MAQTISKTDSPAVRLENVKTVERHLERGQKHRYQIKLSQGQFFYARVEQRGIDVVIHIIDPDGQLLEEVDSPTGDRGSETVVLVTQNSGDYTLEISPFDPLTHPGQYFMTIDKIAPAATTISGRIDQLFIPWDKDNSPGAAVAAVKAGEIIFKKGYGMANLEYDVPISPKTVFHMASVSKQFTAFSIAMLANQEKISLDDDIRKYLPEVPDFGKTITIKHLIHHTSGLRDQWNLLMLAGWRLDDVITREHILKLISNQKELNFDTGEQYMYSNSGYTLMAEIVARVSGQTFPQWTKEHIFDPLGMSSTLFYDDHEKIVKNRAYSYQVSDRGGYKKSVLSYANVGATSLFTTAEDMTKWAMNFDDPRIGGRQLIRLMEERGVLNNNDTIRYAFGQTVDTYKGLKLISHSGGDAGYRTYLGRFPDQRFSVIVLSNLASFNPRAMALKMADLYLSDMFAEEQIITQTGPGYATVEVAPEILETYAGVYEIEPGQQIRIRRNGRQINIRMPNDGWETIYPVNETKFLTLDGQSSCIFNDDDKKVVSQIIINHQNNEIIAQRIDPYMPSMQQLREYSGDYYSDELLTSYSIILRDSLLVLQHQRNSDVSLQAQSKDVFSGIDFYGQINFERDENDQISGFRIDLGRVQHLLFTRQ